MEAFSNYIKELRENVDIEQDITPDEVERYYEALNNQTAV